MSRWSLVVSDDATLLHRTGQRPEWAFEVSLKLTSTASAAQRVRIAHQVRQDIWRACQRVRGFLPLVEVSTSGNETVIRAGGSLMTRSGHVPSLEIKVAAVLDCADNIARWQRHARRAGG
ncbi:MAG: hypothetical protein AAFN51_11895 [Pseudomonadota bacterium]